MEQAHVDAKIAEAMQQLQILLIKLKLSSGYIWVPKFSHLESCLVAKDIEGAVRARRSMSSPREGFGAYIMDAASQDTKEAYRVLEQLIGDLKLYSRYGLVRNDSVGKDGLN